MNAGPKILVVDDEEVICRGVQRILSGKGFQVVTSTDSPAALALAVADDFAAVLLDLKMPRMDGIQFVQELRKAKPTVPVIFVTGYPSLLEAESAERFGVLGHILKPFTPQEIIEAVQRCLRVSSKAGLADEGLTLLENPSAPKESVEPLPTHECVDRVVHEGVLSDRETSVPMETVEHLAHTNLRDCYQCGKCAAGCPMAERMDLLPNQIIRLLQLGHIEKAMQAGAIWQCVSCLTCTTRCPKSVNCAGVLDALRQLSVEHDVASPALRRTVLFQKVFLQNIRRNGRLNELELVGMFKTKGFFKDLSIPLLFKDSMLAPKMIKRGKFHLMGEKVNDRGVVDRIFERCLNQEA